MLTFLFAHLTLNKGRIMLKTVALLLPLLILQGCSEALLKDDGQPINSEYFADATDCLHRASRKEQIKVPTGDALTNIDIPIASDAGFFSACMQHAGHSTPQASPETFLAVSRACLSESQSTQNADDAYAQCVRRSRITVESISDNNKR
jgi:hypothetical protein